MGDMDTKCNMEDKKQEGYESWKDATEDKEVEGEGCESMKDSEGL